jgi:SAM-dependent methyltransferase
MSEFSEASDPRVAPIQEAFERLSLRFGPEDARRFAFTRFSRRSVIATVRSCLDHVSRFAPGARNVLDLGCGTGAYRKMLRRGFPEARIHGVDLVAANLDAALRNGYDSVGRTDIARFVETAPAGSFDLVLCVETLHYVASEDRDRLLGNLARIVRPGCPVVLILPNRESLVRRAVPLRGVAARFPITVDTVIARALRSGFRVSRVVGAELVTAATLEGRTPSALLRWLGFRLGVVLVRD